MTNIPTLGKTAREVIKEALNIDTGGYDLRFETVFDGHYILGHNNRFYRQTWVGSVPVIGLHPESDSFDDWLEQRIAAGEVTIRVKSAGQNPFFNKEYHRATGKKIPLE